ncbi:hypothetical protein MNBD_GAMMA03-164 [hydrothermal vent metagenome]|uniref:DUF1963 domain-containing protein n=1 Tax=hydrothermal vent metagenome TaxID=652676 RepID=A0A3B0W6K0_9ZZZZ
MGRINDFFKRFTYKDKNGENVNVSYVLDGEPKTNEDIEKLFTAFNLSKYFKTIKPLIRPKIDLTLIPDSNIKIGQSKVGGNPDLTNENKWPKTENKKSMSFIAQINCEELTKYDTQQLLPKKGLISFFYCADQEAWGFDPKDKSRFKVLYTENIENLKSTKFPNDLEQHSIFKSNQIKFESCLSIPAWEEDSIEGVIQDEDDDNYSEVSSGSENQIFGYANLIQGSMELECQLVTNGLYCGDPTGYEDPKEKELEKGKKDWILLLQIGSEDDKTGMMWGDSGKIYFWIKKQDLISKNFDNVWCILQCY